LIQNIRVFNGFTTMNTISKLYKTSNLSRIDDKLDRYYTYFSHNNYVQLSLVKQN